MDIVLVKAFFLKYILLPVLIAILAFTLVYIKKRLSFIKMKEMIIYVLVVTIFISLFGLLGFAGNMFTPYWYLLASVFFLIIGTAHVNQLFSRFYSTENNNGLQYTFQIILTFICMLFGAYLFIFLFNWTSPYSGYAGISATCILSFLIPLLFYYSYIQFLSIPFSIYKTWSYTSQSKSGDLEGIDYDKLMVINIELTKKISDGDRFLIKAKTLPEKLSFGEWFHRLIDDYNFKNGSSPIELLDDNQESYTWVFYTKKSFFHLRKYIDFELDMKQNGIKENNLIICKRVIQYKINE